MMFSKEKVAAAAQEIADQLKVVQRVSDIAEAQKDLAKELRALRTDLDDLRSQLKLASLETRIEVMKETHAVVMSVQGAFAEKLSNIDLEIDRMKHHPVLADGHGSPMTPLGSG